MWVVEIDGWDRGTFESWSDAHAYLLTELWWLAEDVGDREPWSLAAAWTVGRSEYEVMAGMPPVWCKLYLDERSQ